MESFTVETKLTPADWQAYVHAVGESARQAIPKHVVWAFVAALTALLGLPWLLDASGHPFEPYSVFWVLLAIVLYLQWARRIARTMAPSDEGTILGAARLEFGHDGIRSTKPGMTSATSWSLVKRVSISRNHLFIWLDRAQAFIVPLRDLPSPLTAQDARTRIESWTNAGVTMIAAPGGGLPDPARAQTFVAEAAGPFPGTDTAIIVLALLSLVVWIGIDRIGAGPDVDFAYWNLPQLSWYALAVLLFAYAYARPPKPALPLRQAVLVTLAGLPFVIASSVLIGRFVAAGWQGPAFVLAASFVAIYLGWASRQLTGSSRVAAIFTVSFCAVLWYWADQRTYFDPSMWITLDDTPMEEWTAKVRRNELTAFEQPFRIDAAIEQVAPSRDVDTAFFLGFAGVGEQKVFAEEIKNAAAIFAKRFNTATRSVQLVNDVRGDSLPMATVAGLSYALKRLASKMNLDRDVLILALSSHGSSKHKLSVSNGDVQLSDLTAEDVRRALDDAGIKWRVIVISACYAGSFFGQLADDRSIVIAAAAADRMSHGCSNDRELTWFGEAFYRDALPRAGSLHQAFEIARDTLAERETHDGVEQSHPQALFGKEIEEKLQLLDRGPVREASAESSESAAALISG